MPKSEKSDSESKENVLSEEESESEMGIQSRNEKILPEYERQRLKRIEENKKRMEALGLKKIATSFMGSVEKVQKKKIDKKLKKKLVDEDEEYNPTEEVGEMSSSSEEVKDDDVDEDFSKSLNKKVKKNISTPKKRVPTKKLIFDSDYVDDDDALMQAIALSLGFTKQSDDSNLRNNTSSKNPTNTPCQNKKENVHIDNDPAKRKRKKSITSRVQMSEDEMLIHFFQFDETEKGGITLRDIQRIASAHDFTWTEKEMADMIYCFDSNGDGKISYDDFRMIVGRCNMLKTDSTGK